MTDNDKPEHGYEVGYRRPPRQTQFKAGQSGNPKGRPKGSFNFSTLIDKELNQKLTIIENGVRKRISKKQAVAKQLVNKAAGGDHKAIPILLTDERSREAAGAAATEQPVFTAEDQNVIDHLLARIRTSEPASDPSNEAGSLPSEEPDLASDEQLEDGHGNP